MNKAGTIVALMLATLLASPCAGQEKSGWDAFDLRREEIAGVTVFYEGALAAKADALRAAFAESMAARARAEQAVNVLLRKTDEIVKDVNRIVGGNPGADQIGFQKRLLGDVLRVTSFPDPAKHKVVVYVITRTRIKEYLRGGGSLPDFEYNGHDDTVTYRPPPRSAKTQEGGGETITVVIPVVSIDTLEKEVQGFFGMFDNVSELAGVAFHEVVEGTILTRLRPYDPYFRWFSDGFANAVAVHLLKKHVSEEAAREFAAVHDAAKYAEIEREVNLYYWMGIDFCIDTHLPTESRLTQARYAYATLEAQRLIDKYGIECVAAILDRACTNPRNDSRNLLGATLEVTGEDIEERFRRYQTFDTREQGLREYTTRANEAMSGRDYQVALTNLIRVHELKFPPDLRIYSDAAYLLFRMGEEGAGDRAMQKHLALLENRGMEKAHFVMQKLFVGYALKCRTFEKANDVAEEILKVEEDFVPALTVRMARLAEAGQIPEAKVVAQRILALATDAESLSHKLAQKVVALKAETPKQQSAEE